jgi:hypothetical protein
MARGQTARSAKPTIAEVSRAVRSGLERPDRARPGKVHGATQAVMSERVLPYGLASMKLVVPSGLLGVEGR